MKRLLILFLLLVLGAPIATGAEPAAKVFAIKTTSISVDHGVELTLPAPAASVFIANPDVADIQVMSPTTVMIFGKRTGETTFMASDRNGHTLDQRTISVIQDLTSLRQELDTAIPGNKIHVQSIPNGIVLTGEARDPSAVTDAYKMAARYITPGSGDIINRVKVSGSNQIQIRVRFAEVSRTVDNTLGIDWGNIASVGGFVFGLASGNTVNPSVTGVGGTTANGLSLFPRPNNPTLTTSNDVIGFSHAGSHLNINGMIDALAQDGLVTVLAEPTLTAMSGETANFLAGGEFPIAVPQGNNQITIEFKSFGVSLAFTPTITGENRINLHVKPEVSQLSSDGAIVLDSISVPSLKTRRAETTVEVGSGESFAIAGLIDNNQDQTVNKYPILGDVPVLGALFRSNQFQSGQTELIVIITPYIVKPTNEQLALPTDGFSPPSEYDRLLALRYSSSNTDARKMSGAPIAERGDAPAVAAAPIAVVTPADVEPQTTLSTTTRTITNIGTKPILSAPALAPAAIRPTTPIPQPASDSVPAATEALPPVRLEPGTVTPSNINRGNAAPAGSGGFILE